MLFDDVKHIKWANNVCELFFTSHTSTAFYVHEALGTLNASRKRNWKKITVELYYTMVCIGSSIYICTTN